jgi:hypothetical protein
MRHGYTDDIKQANEIAQRSQHYSRIGRADLKRGEYHESNQDEV